MQLSPRYDDPPILRFDVPLGDLAVPVVRQRRRLAEILGTLDTEQWDAQSRCDQWSVRDVVCHLIGTNQFWTVSMTSGLAGQPTRYLASFDPVTTPAQMVDGMRAMSTAEVLTRYIESVDAMDDVLRGLDGAGWSMVAESPPGHVSMSALALHALWDAWIHERDIALPLGLTPSREADEVTACLVYAAALGPSFYASNGSSRTGSLVVEATSPDVTFVVDSGPTVVVRATTGDDVAAPCLAGDAVALVEGLSFRAPLEHALDDDDAWLLDGLREVFDLGPDEFAAPGSSSGHGS